MENTTEAQTAPQMLTITDIKNIIPHRYPFLLVDKAIILEPSKKITGFKAVSGNEEFFQGHFPGHPIMPGVLIVEAMAQTACVVLLSRADLKDKLAFFMGIDGVKFRKPVVPGDMLEFHVEIVRAGGRVGKARGEAFVGKDLVAEADFTFAVVDK